MKTFRMLWRGRAGLVAAICFWPAWCAPVHAQLGDTVPSTAYFKTQATLQDGNYREALAAYLSEGRATVHRIDSVCYYAMAGECYYQMGRLPEALDQYTAALKIYLAYPNWMMRLEFRPVAPGPPGARPGVPWGFSKRGALVGAYPESQGLSQGQLDNTPVLQNGGVVQQPSVVPIIGREIVRCTALAMRRRRELLGPISQHDAVSKELLNAFSRRPGPPHTWADAWLDLQLGLAYAGVDNTAQATATLRSSLLVAGQMDHPLTAIALLELGRLAMESGDSAAAAGFFDEATYAAVTYPDPIVLEEAFRYGQLNHLIANRQGPYPPLLPAIVWARSRGSRQLLVSLDVLQAECLAVGGAAPAATKFLDDARAASARVRDLMNSATGARLNYVSAVTAYPLGNVAAGDQALTAALAYERSGSLWLFQLGLADRLAMAGGVSERIAGLLYEKLLRDPTAVDWISSPLECLASLTTPHPLPLEHWFELAQGRRSPDLALEVADRARRHRFFVTLPFGGRLMALRWVLEGPKELLTEPAVLQRHDLLTRYPKYAELVQEADKVRTVLAGMKLVGETSEDKHKQAEQLGQLARIGQQQELILREMAVRREPAEMVFPPVRSTKQLQQALPPGQLLLAFFETSRGMYAFLYSHDRYASWPISSLEQVKKGLTTLLRDLGNFDQNHQIGSQELAQAAWKKSGSKLYELLLDKSGIDLSASIQELVIVPDGILWYLPFEALPVGKNIADRRPLLTRVRIRYAPTTGLAIPYADQHKLSPNIGVFVGKLYPRHDAEVAQTAFSRLARAVPGAVALPSPLPAPSAIFRDRLDGLIVLDDIESNESGPYDWSVAQIDRGKQGSALSAWFALPWGGPDQVMLPGFHSAAESAMKKRIGNGEDLFLSTLGLMSTGVRTILITRWRAGGQSSFDLVREFAQELPHLTPADAWQRSVEVVSDNPLDPEGEPRLKHLPVNTQPPKADHPLFWAGFMLVDSGVPPDASQPKQPQVFDFKAKAADAAPPPARQLLDPPAAVPPGGGEKNHAPGALKKPLGNGAVREEAPAARKE